MTRKTHAEAADTIKAMIADELPAHIRVEQ